MTQIALDDVLHPHQEFCEGLTDELSTHYTSFLASQDGQVVMDASTDEALNHLTHLHHSNCRFGDLPYTMASHTEGSEIDLRAALLQFMVAATPNDDVVNDILGDYDTHLQKMVEYSAGNHFAPSDEPDHIMVDNVPDAVNPVKATLAYVQVPSKDGESVHLNLVFKVRSPALL